MQNKLYTTIAKIHNELKNLRGEHNDITEAIKDIAENTDETIEARGRFSSIGTRIENVENETKSNTVNYTDIDNKIESVKTTLLAKIPVLDSVIIKDENTAIGVKLEGVKHVTERVTRIAPNQTEIVRIDKSKTATKSYVKAYGQFLQDFVNENGSVGSTEYKITATNTTYDKSAVSINSSGASLLADGVKLIDAASPYLLDSTGKRCEVPGIFEARVDTSSKSNIANLFNGDKFLVEKGTLKLYIDFFVPVELTNIFSALVTNGNNCITIVEITFEDKTTTKTRPIVGSIIDIDTSSSKRVTNLFIEYALSDYGNGKGFAVSLLDLSRRLYVEQSGPIITDVLTDIGVSYKDNLTVNVTDSIEEGTDVRYAVTLDDSNESITFIPETINVDYMDFYYPDGQACINGIFPKDSAYVPSEYNLEVNSKDISTYDDIVTLGNNKVIGTETNIEGSINYNDRLIASIDVRTTINDAVPLKIYNFGDNITSTVDGNINANVFRVNEDMVGIEITSDKIKTLNELSLKVNSPYNIEKNKEVWNVVDSKMNETTNIFTSLGTRKEIISLDSIYSVYSHSISLNGVNRVESTNNGAGKISYSILSSSNGASSKTKILNSDGTFEHKNSLKMVKLPTVIFITTNTSHKYISDNIKSRITAYKGIYTNTMKVNRDEVTMKAFIGDKSSLTRISPNEVSGDIRYYISFDGNIFKTYDWDSLKWIDGGVGLTKSELQKINDTMFDSIRNGASTIFIRVKFETSGSLNSISLSFNKTSTSKIATNEIIEKGIRSSDVSKIDFFSLGSEVKSFRLTSCLNSASKLASPKASKYTISKYTEDKWIPIEYTDVREYLLDNGNIIYKNKHTVENRYVKTIITDTESTIATDMNRQSYIESINNINKNHADISERLDALMLNISNLMKAVTGPEGQGYVNNFLINNYKEFNSDTIKDNNVFVINDVQNIVSIEVWSVISSLLNYGLTLRYKNTSMHEYVTNGYVDFDTNGATALKVADTLNSYIAPEGISNETSLGFKTSLYNLTMNLPLSLTPSKMLSNSEYDSNENNSGSYWHSHYNWITSLILARNLSSEEKYVDIILDFGYNKYVASINKLQAGGYAVTNSSGYYRSVSSYSQRTSVSYSYDNKEYVELYSFNGQNSGGGGYSIGGANVPVNRNVRYIRIRLEKTVAGSATVAIKHFSVTVADDDYVYNQDCVLYNKEGIDTTGWSKINGINYSLTVDQPICDIRFMLSTDQQTWHKISNHSKYSYSSVNFNNGMTLNDVKSLDSNDLKMFTGSKLYIAAILRTSNRYKTPVLSEVSVNYCTSDSKDNLIKLDQHDYEAVYTPVDKRLTIRNTSGGEKKFKVLVS